MPEQKNYYEYLGIRPNASEQEIGKAYRQKAREIHPDKRPPDERIQAEEDMKALNQMRDVLLDANKRMAYNQELLKSRRFNTSNTPNTPPHSENPKPKAAPEPAFEPASKNEKAEEKKNGPINVEPKPQDGKPLVLPAFDEFVKNFKARYGKTKKIQIVDNKDENCYEIQTKNGTSLMRLNPFNVQVSPDWRNHLTPQQAAKMALDGLETAGFKPPASLRLAGNDHEFLNACEKLAETKGYNVIRNRGAEMQDLNDSEERQKQLAELLEKVADVSRSFNVRR